MHHTPVYKHELQTELMGCKRTQCRTHSHCCVANTVHQCTWMPATQTQGVKEYASETDKRSAMAHRSTWVVGNKEKGEIWQALINRGKSAHHISPCIPTDYPAVDVYITYTSNKPKAHDTECLTPKLPARNSCADYACTLHKACMHGRLQQQI